MVVINITQFIVLDQPSLKIVPSNEFIPCCECSRTSSCTFTNVANKSVMMLIPWLFLHTIGNACTHSFRTFNLQWLLYFFIEEETPQSLLCITSYTIVQVYRYS